MNQKLQTFWTSLSETLMIYIPQVLMAIAVLFIGLRLIRVFSSKIGLLLDRQNVDPSLKPFLTSVFNISLKILLIISVASMIGVETTSFVAALGAAGFAIGMALQGSLGNFAGGILILIFKPFKVGDYIEAQGHGGTVKEIQIFCTILNTVDNRRVIIPNGALSSGTMVNFSAEKTRRVDLTFGIGYEDDLDEAKKIFNEQIASDSRILSDPQPFIGLLSLGDNSVNFTLRLWVKASDYWPVYFDTQEKIKLALDRAGISIPFPQRDLHLHLKEDFLKSIRS